MNTTSSLGEATQRAEGGLLGALARGDAAQIEWVRSRELIPMRELAEVWRVTSQALVASSRRGEIFTLTVGRGRYCPKEFLFLRRDDIAVVVKQLDGLGAVEKLFFWKRKHGALSGLTVTEALCGDDNGSQLLLVQALARSMTDQLRADASARS